MIRDDTVFYAAIVACGRFGVIYSVVLEVVPSFRVVESVTTPARTAVLQALRDGVSGAGTLFQPLFDLLGQTTATLGRRAGRSVFLEILFNSQNPNQIWVTRRFTTTAPSIFRSRAWRGTRRRPPTTTSPSRSSRARTPPSSGAALHAGGNPLGGIFVAAYITGVQIEMNVVVAGRPFTLDPSSLLQSGAMEDPGRQRRPAPQWACPRRSHAQGGTARAALPREQAERARRATARAIGPHRSRSSSMRRRRTISTFFRTC